MSKYIKIGIGLMIVIILIYSFRGSNTFNFEKYKVELSQYREERNRFMQFNQDSPLPEEGKADFDGLNYFPADSSFRIVANLNSIDDPKTISLNMTNGAPEKYKEIGYAKFTHANKVANLLVMKSVESGDLFLPFWDATNGVSTYGGGRYLDPEMLSNNKILLDFNFAYNPFCAFAESYACPIPPLQNKIPFAVEAGEKIWGK